MTYVKIPGGLYGAVGEVWPKRLKDDPICGNCRQFPRAPSDWLCARCRRKAEAERKKAADEDV